MGVQTKFWKAGSGGTSRRGNVRTETLVSGGLGSTVDHVGICEFHFGIDVLPLAGGAVDSRDSFVWVVLCLFAQRLCNGPFAS